MSDARPTLLSRFHALTQSQKLSLGGGAAAVLALVVTLSMGTGEGTGYKVLFSNVADKDGGAITAALQQANVPYKVEAGGVITVPESQVYDVRLKMAALGLPKGGTVGFELLDSQKFGLTQFVEQINYQRAVEGELARSVEAIQAVESARIRLALPKSTVFISEQAKPTASVVLTLYSGRTLDAGQVAAIVHLVAASVPDLNPKSVTVVDQHGNLLTSTSDVAATGLDPSQLSYVRRVEADITKRIESLLKPLVGDTNVHAEVTADLDFSQNEQTAETFKPNSDPATAAVRSRQSNESIENGTATPSGVPGAQSNQPGAVALGASSTTTQPVSKHTESTVNYEVDKTIRSTKEAVGTIKRLSAAVVVNYKEVLVKGKMKQVPLTPAELAQVNGLVKEAMGYLQSRGDSLNVVNASFAGAESPEEKTLQSSLEAIAYGVLNWIKSSPMEFLRMLFTGVLVLYALFFVVRPVIKRLTATVNPASPVVVAKPAAQNTTEQDEDAVVTLSTAKAPGEMTQAEKEQAIRLASYAENLESVRRLAQDDPRVVAQIIRGWLAASPV